MAALTTSSTRELKHPSSSSKKEAKLRLHYKAALKSIVRR